MIRLLLSVLFLPSIALTGYEQCKTNALKNNDPVALLAWMRNNGNRIKTIEDILCCMPEKYRDDYVIAHSSLSAQSSHYHSPRVIFGDLASGIMFSVATGTDPNLPQTSNIEIMTNQNGRLTLYDLEINKQRKHLSEQNPQACVSCHGSGGILTRAGPRPIFDNFPWPRMTGVHLDRCPERTAFMTKATEVAERAVRSSPRFRCLAPAGSARAPSKDGSFVPARHNASAMDNILERANDRRVAREMQASPNFNRIAPFLVGVAKGCVANQSSGSPLPQMGSVQDWLPNQALLNTQLLNIESSLRRQNTSEGLKSEVSKKLNTAAEETRNQEAKFAEMTRALARGETPSMGNSQFGFMLCGSTTSETTTELNELSNILQKMPLSFQVYAYDKVLKDFENGNVLNNFSDNLLRESLFRWAFESRGVDTLGWDMNVIPNYTRGYMNSVMQLPLAQKYKDISDPNSLRKEDFFEPNSPFYDAKKHKAFVKMCEELKLASQTVNPADTADEVSPVQQ